MSSSSAMILRLCHAVSDANTNGNAHEPRKAAQNGKSLSPDAAGGLELCSSSLSTQKMNGEEHIKADPGKYLCGDL